MPTAMFMASTGPLDLRICSLSSLPPGSQGLGPSKVDRMSSCNSSHSSHLGLYLTLFGFPCSIMPHSHSPSGGCASYLCLPVFSGTSSSCLPSYHGLSTSCLAMPCSSALGLCCSASTMCLPSCGGVSTLWPATPCAQGINTLDL